MSNRNEDTTYTMGRTQAETERLIRQSRLYSGLTRRMLTEAGLTNGMKVLDIGSGAGDVAMAAAELVGPEGRVVGVDVNAEILETARARVAQSGLEHVEFVAGDARTLDLESDFDALIGRFVLMYLPDPAGALRQLSTRLRPGGIVAFHEIGFNPNRLPHAIDTPWRTSWSIGRWRSSNDRAPMPIWPFACTGPLSTPACPNPAWNTRHWVAGRRDGRDTNTSPTACRVSSRSWSISE